MGSMRRLIALPLIMAFLASCAAQTALQQSPPEGRAILRVATTTSTTAAPVPASPEQERYPGFLATTEEHPTLAAMTRGDIPVYAGPDGVEPIMTLEGTTILGTVTVVSVIGDLEGQRIQVMLPGRPNGHTGWVDIGLVDLYPVDGEIVIDLSERTLTFSSSETSLTTSVTVGSSHNPTPTGTFFVTDSVKVADPHGPWGPRALGLSARSDTITEFNGGDGIIGIHGTNRPDRIGEAASLGCVRLPNDVITRLHELVALGTPVVIEA